jgi:hypothetical protein
MTRYSSLLLLPLLAASTRAEAYYVRWENGCMHTYDSVDGAIYHEDGSIELVAAEELISVYCPPQGTGGMPGGTSGSGGGGSMGSPAPNQSPPDHDAPPPGETVCEVDEAGTTPKVATSNGDDTAPATHRCDGEVDKDDTSTCTANTGDVLLDQVLAFGQTYGGMNTMGGPEYLAYWTDCPGDATMSFSLYEGTSNGGTGATPWMNPPEGCRLFEAHTHPYQGGGFDSVVMSYADMGDAYHQNATYSYVVSTDINGNSYISRMDVDTGETTQYLGSDTTCTERDDPAYTGEWDSSPKTVVSAAAPATWDIGFGEFSGDNRTDIFVPRGSDGWFYSYGASGQDESLQGGAFTQYDADRYAYGDFDGNGLTDIFYINGTSWWINYGGTQWDKVKSTSNPIPFHKLFFGDFNDDGKTDVGWATESSSAGFRWWKATGSENNVAFSGYYKLAGGDFTRFPADDYLVGDFDADGYSDLLYASGNSWVVLWKGRTPQVVSSNSTRGFDLRVADLNADGRSDVLEYAEVETISCVSGCDGGCEYDQETGICEPVMPFYQVTDTTWSWFEHLSHDDNFGGPRPVVGDADDLDTELELYDFNGDGIGDPFASQDGHWYVLYSRPLPSGSAKADWARNWTPLR